MNWTKYLYLLPLVLLPLVLLALTGCQTPLDPYTHTADGPNKGGNPDLIRVGDEVTIRFTDIPNPPDPTQQRVREDGTITLQFGQDVTAAGKTVSELQSEIEQKYVPDYYARLTVFVELEQRHFTVQGEVNMPGNRSWLGETTVLSAIAAAGDFTDFANKRKVLLTRSKSKQQIEIDCVKSLRNRSEDVIVYPGDHIYVPRRFY